MADVVTLDEVVGSRAPRATASSPSTFALALTTVLEPNHAVALIDVPLFNLSADVDVHDGCLRDAVVIALILPRCEACATLADACARVFDDDARIVAV